MTKIFDNDQDRGDKREEWWQHTHTRTLTAILQKL